MSEGMSLLLKMNNIQYVAVQRDGWKTSHLHFKPSLWCVHWKINITSHTSRYKILAVNVVLLVQPLNYETRPDFSSLRSYVYDKTAIMASYDVWIHVSTYLPLFLDMPPKCKG